VPLLTSLPLLLVAATTGVLALLVTRALRDESVVDALRREVRRIGETHGAVCTSRGVHPGVTCAGNGTRQRRG